MNNLWHKMNLMATRKREHPLIFELLESGKDGRFLEVGEVSGKSSSGDGFKQFFGLRGSGFKFWRLRGIVAGVPLIGLVVEKGFEDDDLSFLTDFGLPEK
jgi:hypothetical protein